jgi:hypothetical protein
VRVLFRSKLVSSIFTIALSVGASFFPPSVLIFKARTNQRLLMSSTTESNMRRDSGDFAFGGGFAFEPSATGGGPFTVFFRLVSADHSPNQRLHPITPLHTPFVQSPVQSPAQSNVPLYPIASPVVGPVIPANGVFYSAAPYAPRPPIHISGSEGTVDPSNLVKARAMSADIHHSPPFHYVHPQPHRSSFCLPLDTGADLAMVSEEMLLSAMPDRYDD